MRPKPADSGPHYQNEIWLDFTTDSQGAATGTATVQWEFCKGETNSVIIHATHSSTEHGKAGTAGDRLACLTASF